MKEKELNLSELLKGCEGEELYSPLFGNVTLIKANSGNTTYPIQVLPIDCTDRTLCFGANGTFWGEDYPNSKCMLFPSRALYEKYPLDAYSWMEWKEEKSKYILAVKISSWYDGDNGREGEEYGDNEWFRFKTKEEAKKAKEIVREALQKFHQENDKK